VPGPGADYGARGTGERAADAAAPQGGVAGGDREGDDVGGIDAGRGEANRAEAGAVVPYRQSQQAEGDVPAAGDPRQGPRAAVLRGEADRPQGRSRRRHGRDADRDPACGDLEDCLPGEGVDPATSHRPNLAAVHDCPVAEGDTILRAARRLEEAIGGEVVAVATPNPRGRTARLERLDGHRLDRVESHGKHLLLRFDNLVLHSHMGMSGSWHTYQRGERWRKPRRSAWVVVSGERQEAVQFGGPTLRLLAPAKVHLDRTLARLGPDVLADDFDPEAVAAAMRARPDRTLGDALLDQRLLAGVGNIFKSEACFAARVDPWRAIGDLSDEELRAVLAAARELMLGAVASGRQPHAIYRRRGPCAVCGGPVSVRGQGDDNRTTYWCPRCQA
jgi:endonuclease VIII